MNTLNDIKFRERKANAAKGDLSDGYGSCDYRMCCNYLKQKKDEEEIARTFWDILYADNIEDFEKVRGKLALAIITTEF